jgi:hypothetical protein
VRFQINLRPSVRQHELLEDRRKVPGQFCVDFFQMRSVRGYSDGLPIPEAIFIRGAEYKLTSDIIAFKNDHVVEFVECCNKSLQ